MSTPEDPDTLPQGLEALVQRKYHWLELMTPAEVRMVRGWRDGTVPKTNLPRPEVIMHKNVWFDPMTPEETRAVRAWRLQAAERLRKRLCTVPFYANRAATAADHGADEMAYWLSLQSSQMTADEQCSEPDPR